MSNLISELFRKKPKRATIFLVLFSLAVILLILDGFVFYQTKKDTKVLADSQTATQPAAVPETPVPLSSIQKQQLIQGTSTSTSQKLFQIVAGNYYFTPNAISVNQGDTVTVILTNLSGVHNFTIDSLHVGTQDVKPGQPAVVTFTASQKGTFTYTSTLPQDTKSGMTGTITVQ